MNKWTCVFQAHIVQGSNVLGFILTGFNNTDRELDTAILVDGKHHDYIF